MSSIYESIICWQEAEAARGLPLTDTSKSLINVFFAQRGTSKVEISLTKQICVFNCIYINGHINLYK